MASASWWPALASAWLLGLLGGGHCLGMCGGLMGALSVASGTQRWPLLLGYNLGRVASYTLAGLLFGSLGLAVAHTPAFGVLRTLAAGLLIAMGLYLAGWWHGLTYIETLGRGLWRRIQPIGRRLLPVRTPAHALALGALWGWLPCGLVYSALLWSAAQGDALKSAALMLAFGLGTWPMMLATGVAGAGLLGLLRKRGVRAAAGLLVLAFGLWSLPGAHQHWVMRVYHQTDAGTPPRSQPAVLGGGGAAALEHTGPCCFWGPAGATTQRNWLATGRTPGE